MEHIISFEKKEARFIINDIDCDLKLLGFIPSDKSLPLKKIIPIKYVGGDKIFLRFAEPMIMHSVDGVVVGETYYILRAFHHQNKLLLCLCELTNPIFQSAPFDGKLYINPNNIFN